MSKKIISLFFILSVCSVLFAKSVKRDFTIGGFIELDKEFSSDKNIISKIEKISDNKAYVECTSVIFPAAGDSVIGAHTVEVGYYFTVGKEYKQGKLIKINDNSLTFEYETEYENPVYLFSTSEDKQVTFYFYDSMEYDWDRMIISNGESSKEIKRSSSWKFMYSLVYDGLENGKEYSFNYCLIDKNGEMSVVKHRIVIPNGESVVATSGFYCDISNLSCLERNRTLVFRWSNPSETKYDKLVAEINGRTYEMNKSATELIVNNLSNSQLYEVKFYFVNGKEISSPIFYKGTPKFSNTVSSFYVSTNNQKATLTWREDPYEEFDLVSVRIEKQSEKYWESNSVVGTYTLPKGTCFYEATELKNDTKYDFFISLIDNFGNKSTEIYKTNNKPTFPNSLKNIITKSTDYNVELSWDNSTLDKYKSVEIICSDGKTQNVDFPQNTSIFNNLLPNKNYSFMLRMVDEIGTKSDSVTVYGFTSIKNDILNPQITKNDGSVFITWDESLLTPYVYEIKIRDGLNTYKVKKGESNFTIDKPTGGTILLSTVTLSGDESYAINLNY